LPSFWGLNNATPTNKGNQKGKKLVDAADDADTAANK